MTAAREGTRGRPEVHRIYSDDEAVDTLVLEGHVAADVTEQLTLLVRSGLVLSQPQGELLLTDDELDLLRLRLREQGE